MITVGEMKARVKERTLVKEGEERKEEWWEWVEENKKWAEWRLLHFYTFKEKVEEWSGKRERELKRKEKEW